MKTLLSTLALTTALTSAAWAGPGAPTATASAELKRPANAELRAIRDPRAEPRFDDPEFPVTLAWPPATETLMERLESSSPDCGTDPSVLPISSYDDDPFVEGSTVECMDASGFERDADGSPILSNAWVRIEEEPVIYRQDETTGRFVPFAHNPWPCVPLEEGFCAAPTSNEHGDFFFPDEARFPVFEIERDADGRPVLKDGLQVWLPRDLHHGFTTALEAANSAREAAQLWAGRDLPWGIDNQLSVNAHTFIDFNAVYSPSGRSLFFGVVPYRMPGAQEIRMFETATSWDIAAHEAGHALHHELKPNVDNSDQGFRTWGESFGDQMAMWASLRDPDRVRALLAETDGEVILLRMSNSLTRVGEVYAAFVGEGTGLRDAAHGKTVSDTADEHHDRSEVLTGAAYQFFLLVYDELAREQGAGEQALTEAGTILGTFLARAADYTPENTMTLEDVAKAYLKVDKEFFRGRYHARLVEEFIRRELFDADSLAEWAAHEAAVPNLGLPPRASRDAIERLVQANLDTLGIGPSFGLAVQSVIRDQRSRPTVVRVQLTDGRGAGAVLLENHGILTFRASGRLADYHAPLPPDASQGEVLALIDEARQLGLDQHGAPLAIVRGPDGHLSVEARVMRGSGIDDHVEAFTLDNPQGKRREILAVVRGGDGR